MKKSALFYLLSLLWPVVVVTRTANAVERSLTISVIVDTVGGKEYCKTPWDAQENFDNFTWWNVQIQLPADLSVVGVSYNTNASASAKEDGFVQAANGEEVVLVNYTFLFDDEDDDGAQDPFVVQWTYNDQSEWYTYEFCQNDNGRSSGVDCRDTSTRGLYFGTCWHERDGMSGWGTTTRSASLIVSVDCCCSRSSSSSSSPSTATASLWASNMTFSVATASALATRVLLVLLGLVTLLLLLGTLLVGRKSTCSRMSQTTSNTNINNNNYKYYDDCNHQKESGGGSGNGGWLSFWWQMESSRNQASAADDHNDDDDNKGNNHHHGIAIRTKQEGFTTVREFQ
jgi:hypothetical protein